jgi:hypothetical protein
MKLPAAELRGIIPGEIKYRAMTKDITKFTPKKRTGLKGFQVSFLCAPIHAMTIPAAYILIGEQNGANSPIRETNHAVNQTGLADLSNDGLVILLRDLARGKDSPNEPDFGRDFGKASLSKIRIDGQVAELYALLCLDFGDLV